MPELILRCKDKRFVKGDWVLRLTESGAQLLDPNCITHARFPIVDAEARLLVPSFWMSVSDLGVVADDGTTIWFLPHPDRVAEFKRYRAGAVAAQISGLAAQGPEAIRTMRHHGWLTIAAGIAVIMLAVAGTIIALQADEPLEPWRMMVFRWGAWAGVALGLALLVRGLIILRRARRAADELPRRA